MDNDGFDGGPTSRAIRLGVIVCSELIEESDERTGRQYEQPVRHMADRVTRGEPVAKGVVSTVTFTDDGRVHGHAGVNRFMGGFKQLEGAIEFAPLATTRMAGIEPASSHETGLLAALTGRRPFSVDAEILMVGSGADEVRFRRIVDAAGDTAGLPRPSSCPGRCRIANVWRCSPARSPRSS